MQENFNRDINSLTKNFNSDRKRALDFFNRRCENTSAQNKDICKKQASAQYNQTISKRVAAQAIFLTYLDLQRNRYIQCYDNNGVLQPKKQNSLPSIGDRAQFLYLQSLLSYSTDNYDAARQNIEQAIQIAPKNAEYYLLKSEILLKLDSHEKADSARERAKILTVAAIRTHPCVSINYYNMSQLYARQKNYPAAITYLRGALELEPENTEYIKEMNTLRMQDPQSL